MKKLFVIFVVLFLGGALALTWATRQMPGWFVSVLENSLHKEVVVEQVHFVAPLGFKVEKLAVLEGEGPFRGEESFYVERASIQLEWVALLKQTLQLHRFEIENPRIVIRKYKRDYWHVLTQPMPPAQQSGSQASDSGSARPRSANVAIDLLKIQNGWLRFVDYDVAEDGFAIDMKEIGGVLQDFSTNPTNPARFNLEAKLLQGRTQALALFYASGWLHPKTLDTDTNIRLDGLWIPHFAPYYAKVTSAEIQSGFMDVQSTTTIRNRDWNTNARADIKQLFFNNYETGNQLFGFDAATLVSLLTSRRGAMVLDLVIREDLKKPGITFKEVLRKAIQRSLKNTVLANIQNVVENTIDLLSDEGEELLKDGWKGAVRDLLEIVD